MTCGIYKITNKINYKIYIGQSVNIEQRWHEHWSKRKKSKTPFHLALDKYRRDNFIWEIIENVPVHKLDEREIYWINYFKSNNKKIGYNRTAGGEGGPPQPILQYDLNNNFIKKWNSITEASIALSIPTSNISACASKKPHRKSAGGFQWRYPNDTEKVFFYKETNKGKKRVEGVNVGGRPSKKPIIVKWRQQNPNGTKAQCIKDTGVSKATVYRYWESE